MTYRDLAVLAALTLLTPGPAAAQSPTEVSTVYADIALATFADALTGAEALDAAIETLVTDPGPETLAAARAAWIAARVPYQQTEVYRFGNPAVDAWEGRVNAWPLDEGLIDYVAAGYGSENDANDLYTLNVIASRRIAINGKEVDASVLTPTFLQDVLSEAGDIETNVATGYHAIEFLLWGQDLNGTGPGAGDRPATDFDATACTGGNCDRRGAYLAAASDLLVADLREMVAAWGPGGEARARLFEDGGRVGLTSLLTGMGSLSYGELAGERMKLGLMLHDPEEEQDCFSDNTHNSHYHDVIGIRNVYTGRYTGRTGNTVQGPSLQALLADRAPEVERELTARIEATVAAFAALKSRAETVEAYDQMIAEGNTAGNEAVEAAIDALVAQVPAIERAVAALDLGTIAFAGSDSLDNPTAVFQ